jgi:hypothetical protein
VLFSVKNKGTPSADRKEFDGKQFQLLQRTRSISEARLVKSPKRMRNLRRFFLFGFINLFSGLLCLGCVLLGGCANDNLSDDRSQHHQHHRGGGQGDGGEGGGGFDRSGASSSATPIPGL